MKHLTEVPKSLLGCSIDPLSIGAAITSIGSLFAGGTGASLAAGAAGAGAGLAASSLAGGGEAPAPAAAPSTPAPPPQANDPVGQRSGIGAKAPTSPSFVGSAAVPQQQGYGGKTLLGQ